MQYVINGGVIYTVINIVPWTKPGTSFVIGGSFAIVSGDPAQKLMPSTNATQGYANGQMLATASGVKGDASPSGLTAGGIYNVDASSDDTGQQFWNGMIICDAALHQILPVETSYAGTLQVATPAQGWVIRQQYLYTSGTKDTDATLVANQLANFVNYTNTNGAKGTLSKGQTMNGSGNYETIFGY